ncbi:MAG: hypothetical protein ACFWT5_04780 [Pseudomonas helleri]
MLLQPPATVVETVGRLSEHERKMVLMFRTLKRSDQRVVYKVAEEKQQLYLLLRQVEELSARLEYDAARL